ncbi:hypothetical protein DRH29_01555 [candidate division Kazan bacterium]|uniref:Glycosyltransferase RgtA/B/C/D-like domain-containing protein n=1 Tax=candidate division Kazan bacterium TaxID=2202143 RepID=A0A420ZD99_UNCK3|nr:MAG: hypothetical protein DRH29_01555 [candidate division Kazan bacterium]
MVSKFISTKLFAQLYLPILIIFLAGSRWLYKSQHLFHHDSVQFALALNEFDVIKHQPHPPGYIIYVGLGKLINYLVADPNIAFITLSILASLAGLIIVYYLANEIFGKVAGYLAGIFYVTNASVWFHGTVAEVYIVEVVLMSVVLLLLYRFWRTPKINLLLIAVAILGLLGGIRQTAEIFILPITIYVVISHWSLFTKYWKLISIIFLIANLVWFIPLVYLSGGILPYFRALSLLSVTSLWILYAFEGTDALIKNGALLWQTIKQSAFVYLPVLFLSLLPFIAAESKARFPIIARQLWFWFWVMVPGLVLLLITLMRNPGYGLFFIIVLLLLASGAIVLIADIGNHYHKNFGTLFAAFLVVAIISVQVYSFFNVPALSLDYISASRQSVIKVDSTLDKLLSHVENNFTPDDTIIFVNGDLVFFGVRHLQYYLPQYDIYSYRPSALAYDKESVIWHVRGMTMSDYLAKIPVGSDIKHLVFWGSSKKFPKNEFFQELYISRGMGIGFFDTSKTEVVESLSSNEYFVNFDFEMDRI